MTNFNATVNEFLRLSYRLDAGVHHRTQWEQTRLNAMPLSCYQRRCRRCASLLLEVGSGATSSMPTSAAVSSPHARVCIGSGHPSNAFLRDIPVDSLPQQLLFPAQFNDLWILVAQWGIVRI